MLPVPAVAVAAVRSMSTAAPGAFRVVLARLKASTGFVGTTVDDIIRWVGENKMNAAMLAATIASVGFSIEGAESPELASVSEGKLSLVDYGRIIGAGEKSETLDLKVEEVEKDLATAREILSFARSHFGSVNRAIEAHRMMQAFFEMPLVDVVAGFNHLKT